MNWSFARNALSVAGEHLNLDSNRRLLMKKIIGGVFALFLLVFLSACPIEYSGPGGGSVGPGGRVAQPFIDPSPSRNFNDERIQISFRSTTPDAVFYYTLDGSIPSPATGIRFNAPFFLEPNNNNTPRPGHIQVRVIATREGMTNSLIRNQNFQIFETMPALYWDNRTTEMFYGTARGFSPGLIRVGIRLQDGVIDAAGATFVNGYSGFPDTASDFTAAMNHARAFWTRMNHWDFDTNTGATYSSRAIREAARLALVAAGVIQN